MGNPAIQATDLKGFREKFHWLAATARIANAPSVAGNVFLGIALAVASGHPDPAGAGMGFPTALLVLSGICLYFSGNFLNDWADRGWDATHRPERALPQGLFTPRLYLAVSCAFGLLGLCTAAAVGLQCLVVALAIAVFILIYTGSHKRTGWSVVPMGLCRALLPLLGAAGFLPLRDSPPALFAIALGLFCHIAGLSLSARGESRPGSQAGLLRFARCLFLLAAAAMFLASWQGLSCALSASLAGLLPYGLWIALCLTIFRRSVHAHVSNLLAGIPLVDWMVLLPLALSAALPGGFSTASLIIPPLAFLSGKALQRLAPAT